jgi:two-component system sensor histidine kinase BarA
MRLKPGIKFRMMLLGMFPAALVGFTVLAFFVRAGNAELESGLRERGDLVARQVASASASILSAGDRARLQALADATAQQSDAVEVAIFDEAELLATSRRDARNRGTGNEKGTVVATVPIVKPQAPNPRADVDPAALPAPVTGSAGAVVGKVSVALSRRKIQNSQREKIAYSLWIVSGGLLLAALLAYRLWSRMGSPILNLTAVVQRLSEGQLETRAEFSAEAELAELQIAFNAMAAELQKNRQNLEDQVQQATRRLQETLKSLEKRNADLELARQQAEAQTRLKSQFLGQMSHEIRTPMNGIIGFSEILAQTPLNEEQAEQLRLIERSAKNLLVIINEILDLSKLEAGKISLNIYRFMLRPYLEDAIAIQAPRATHLPIILWVEPAVPRTIVGDPVRLQQVINNLLGNALKFTRNGRIVVRVRLRKKAGQERLFFSVSDSGNGISPQAMEKLFVPFLQLSEYAVNHERGAGLGLTIAKNIVERMEGRMHVASRLGKGSTFWFSLPLSEQHENPVEPATEFSAALVDAHRLSQQALRYQLESLGVKVSCFASFDEFIRDYDPVIHGRVALLNAQSLQDKVGIPISRWLEQCKAKDATPILILRERRQRLLSFYRQQGALCLSQPVGTERLRAALRSTRPSVQPESPGRLVKTELPRGDKRFLVADDNEINRMLLRAQLSKFGAEILEARDGREALDLSMTQRFDLIFLDLQMPHLDGHTVMQKLRSAPGVNRYTPMVAITAHAQPEQKDALMRDGFADCLIKPIMDNQVVRLIDERLHAGNDPASQPTENLSNTAEAYCHALLEKTNGNRKLASTVAARLFQELPEQLQGIEAALTSQEYETARRLTHLVHGSAAFCGLNTLRKAAADLESGIIRSEAAQRLLELKGALAQEIRQLTAQQEAILDGLSPA